MPVVAPGTDANTFRRVVKAPFSPPSSPVVERGALSTEVPPTLNEVRCQGIADPVIHGQASAVLEPTPHVSGLSGDIVEVFLVVFCIRGGAPASHKPACIHGNKLVWRTKHPSVP